MQIEYKTFLKLLEQAYEEGYEGGIAAVQEKRNAEIAYMGSGIAQGAQVGLGNLNAQQNQRERY